MKEQSQSRIYVGTVALVQYANRLEIVHPKMRATLDARKLERWLLARLREQITGGAK